jgi:RNA polymerase sigma-70 factor (ECF subfamily)
MSNEVDRHFHAQKRTVARSQSFDEEGTEPRDFEYVLRQRQSSPPQQAQDNESRQSLEMAITDLPDAQQTAIRMRYIENMRVTEIAHGMSRSNTAVAGLLKRGLKQLRTQMVSHTESI